MSNYRYRSFICLIFVLASLQSCTRKVHSKLANKQLYPITASSPRDSSILKFYQPYKELIDSQMNVVIGVADKDITAARPEGPLNNLMVDAMEKMAKQKGIRFDLVHCNYKSLRVPILKGPIKTFKVFELMPFENLLVTIKMTGQQVLDLFNYMAKEGGDPIAGASFTISSEKAENVLINDKPLDLASVYTILTSDYVANGGDGASAYLQGTERVEYPIKVRDALLEYIREESKAGRAISPKVEGRVKRMKE